MKLKYKFSLKMKINLRYKISKYEKKCYNIRMWCIYFILKVNMKCEYIKIENKK